MFWRKSKLLILYSTVDGHTKNICEYIYNKLKGKKRISIYSIEESENYKLEAVSYTHLTLPTNREV